MKPRYTQCPICGKPCFEDDEEHEEIKVGKFWRYVHYECWVTISRKGGK